VAANATRRELLDDLEAGATQYEEVAGLEGVSHLRLWKRVFDAVQ
jgi:hypothetical protein